MKSLLLILTATTLLSAAEKPNVLFLFADDQSYETIRALGHTDIDTPNLDRLAANGTTFTHTYNMGAWHGAVCVASRTMLVTGKTVWRAKAAEKKLSADLEAKLLWPQRMAAQGYETYFSGKWHISTDVSMAFDHVVNKRPGMPNDVAAGYNRPITGQPDPWNPSDPKFEGFWKGGKHWSEVLGDDSVAFIGQAAKSENPFFMYLAFNAPHDPRQSPKEYVDRYPLDRVKVPENFLPEYPQKEDFIVTGPGVKAGAKIASPIHLQDAMATALDLAGADREGIEFQSVRPLLAGEKGGLTAVYAAYMDTQRAVIHDGWKLILYPKAKVAKLFHLTEDPQETKDLAADPAMAGRKKALFAKFQELQQRYDDKLKLEGIFPEL